MDGWFEAFLVFGFVAVVAGGITIAMWRSDGRGVPGLVFGVALVLTMFTFFMASFKIVGAKDIGVPVTFGKPSGSVLHNGWNWKNPVTQVHVFDGALQTEQFSTDKEDAGDPIQVRLFTGSIAGVNVTFQWKLADDNSVKQIYLNYRQPQNINTQLVKRLLQQALNNVFENYNPYAALIAAQTSTDKPNTPGTQQVAVSYTDLQKQAFGELSVELAKQGVDAVSLTIARVDYDQATQTQLSNLGAAIANTQIAIQNEKTAQAQGKANAELNAQPATGTTLTQLCIQATLEMAKEGHPPAGAWNCFGPTPTVTTTGK